MKKIFFLLLILAVCSGCSQSYQAEKDYYNATKQLENLQKNKGADLKPQDFENIVGSFQKIVDKYPGTVKAADSLFVIARIRAMQRDFGKSRAALKVVIQNFTGIGDKAAEARFQIAGLYEVEGDWDNAETSYWETAEYHPMETKGLYAPIHIILHAKRLKNADQQAQAYTRAMKHYKDLLKQVGPIQASAKVKNYVALTYLANDNYDEAKKEWRSIAKEFPQSPYAPLSLLAAAEVSVKHQQNFDEAIAIYSQFLEEYPTHPLTGNTTIRVGLLHNSKKDYAGARKWFQQALDDYYQGKPAQESETQLLIAKTYQDEGNWPEAEKNYQEIQLKYPETLAALQVPFAISMYYESQGQTDKAEQAFSDAVAKYEELAKKHPGTEIEATAKRFIMSAYAKKGDWNQILSSIDADANKETDPNRKGQWLILKAMVVENRMQDKEKALILYQDFISEYPNHALANVAKTRIEALSKS